jgi:ribulose 1,5-bisphosphate carboxylase large subunit-like protein
MVQPFARQAANNGQPIHLVMEEMQSGHDATPLCSAEYSNDKMTWKPIPKPIRVHGSTFALSIKNLRIEEFEFPLTQTRVAVGPSRGRNGGQYIVGQVDKACLTVLPARELVNVQGKFDRSIGLVADLIEPYSVFLRGTRSN